MAQDLALIVGITMLCMLSPGPDMALVMQSTLAGDPKGALFYLGVFTQVITPRTPPLRTIALVSAMVLTSAVFWVVFVATLHLPPVRTVLARSRQTLERAFGVLLVLLGLRVAAQD